MNDLLGTPVGPKAQLRMTAEAYGATEAFDAWEGVLKKKKAAMGEWAWKCRLKKARALMQAGNNIAEVIERSALAGWTGLFPVPKEEKQREQTYDLSLARPGESQEQFEARMRASR